LAIDDKFEPEHEHEPDHEHDHDIDTLIEVGKEKGYLTYGDVNDMLPDEMGSSPEDLDDLITTIGTQGIDLLDGPKFSDKDFELEDGEEG
jgi:RNA polymerase primary sigma factor